MSAAGNNSNVTPYAVMIVDDSFLMRNVIKNILEKDPSFNVINESSNGKKALEALETESPDIILLDIEMPVMDGLEFLKAARMITDAKIIVISSIVNIDSPTTREAISLGAIDIINKPSGVLSVDMEDKKSSEILEAIHRCMKMCA